ncbi:hypothetical protein R1flu_028611 [Riccia fluitans]|uniref:Uncharacterized protein n=1 Tax=Riccia fluitans TaxID=41844 RepID=A0ABD1XMU8_9MARC
MLCEGFTFSHIEKGLLSAIVEKIELRNNRGRLSELWDYGAGHVVVTSVRCRIRVCFVEASGLPFCVAVSVVVYQAPETDRLSRGMKVKHLVQLVSLTVLFTWLLYQLNSSHNVKIAHLRTRVDDFADDAAVFDEPNNLVANADDQLDTEFADSE